MKKYIIIALLFSSNYCLAQRKNVYKHKATKEIKVADSISRKEAYIKYIELKKKNVPDSVNVYFKMLNKK